MEWHHSFLYTEKNLRRDKSILDPVKTLHSDQVGVILQMQEWLFKKKKKKEAKL